MATTHILAIDGTVEVDAPETRRIRQRAAAYTTMAAAARFAKGGPINRLESWVRATHARAVEAPGDDLWAQMERWAAVAKDRHGLLGPVCDLLLLRVRRDGGQLVDVSRDVPDLVHRAAVELFGHDAGGCEETCEICDLARSGDWPRALRLVVKDAGDIVGVALTDAYKAARRGGLIPAVTKSLDPDAGVTNANAVEDPPAWWGRKQWPL